MKDVQVVYASTATTADHNIDFTTPSVGGIFVISTTAETATASVVFTIQGVDPVSGNTWDILASAAVTTVTTTLLTVHPSLTVSANVTAKNVLPQAVRINCNHDDADSFTYSVSFIGVD